MPTPISAIRIGIYGSDSVAVPGQRTFGLWPTGYHGALTAAGAEPIVLPSPAADESWDQVLKGLNGLVLSGSDQSTPGADEEGLCHWCRSHKMPLLAVDHGLHLLNTSFGGSLYLDLPRELPEALQHRHPPEFGVRHTINVSRGSQLAAIYGEGEIVVNSEHRRALQRLARGFRVSARALDGVIEAVEGEMDGWFALGVQWQPASATASGLDIQLFRALVDRCARRAPRGRGKRKSRRVLAEVA